jgi:DNA-binding MarR family transcriptional regulator
LTVTVTSLSCRVVSVPTRSPRRSSPTTVAPPDLPETFRALVAVKASLYAEIDRCLRSEHGMSLAALDAMLVVWEHRGGCRAGDLADALDLSTDESEALAEELVAAGYATRRAEPARVVLTLRGSVARRRAGATLDRVLGDRLGQHLSSEDIAMLASALVALRGNLACAEVTC